MVDASASDANVSAVVVAVGADPNAWSVPRAVETAVNLLLSVVTVSGNGVIIAAIRTYEQLPAESKLLIINLAIADLLVGLLSLTTTILLAVDALFMALSKTVCVFVMTAIMCTVGASFVCMPVITFDRYVAIVHPYHYPRIVNGNTIWLMLALPWLYACIWIPLMLTYERYTPQSWCLFEIAWQEDFARVPIPLFLANTFILVTMNAAIFITAWKNGRAIHAQQAVVQNADSGGADVPAYHSPSVAMKLAQIYALVVGIYIFCYTWTNEINVLEWSGYREVGVMIVLRRISITLMFANSAANIFIYSLRMKEFREHMWRLVRCQHVGVSVHSDT